MVRLMPLLIEVLKLLTIGIIAYLDNRFNPEVDKKTGFHTRNILCVAMRNSRNEILGVIQVLNKTPNTVVFNKEDEMLLTSFAALGSF